MPSTQFERPLLPLRIFLKWSKDCLTRGFRNTTPETATLTPTGFTTRSNMSSARWGWVDTRSSHSHTSWAWVSQCMWNAKGPSYLSWYEPFLDSFVMMTLAYVWNIFGGMTKTSLPTRT
jgi:hypothetical protein